ncbi:MAG: deoxyribonuclease IV [Kiritimatiellae bacterium]|nr:deoxyribonuclease IV [Kiritimatiellia bacterium]
MDRTFFIGCHLSAAEGFRGLARDAIAVGANVFQFFTRNPRGGAAKPLDPEDVSSFLATARERRFGPILAHAPYTLNACSAKPEVRRFARETFADDLLRMESVPGNLYNFHPGSHVGQGAETGVALVAETLDAVLRPEQTTTVLLETMSGKGSEIGGTFEELRAIIDRTALGDRLGVCLDTCHVWDAGYDIVRDLDGVLRRFDAAVGLDRLRAIHLNDSKNPLGSRKDRHEKLGLGHIGLDALARVVNHPLLRHLPFYLETPQDDLSGWASEIATLRSLRT